MKKLLLFVIVTSVTLYSQQFRFVIWGDSQFQNPDVFEEQVRKTVLLNPSFVIHVGDMIHGYTYNIDNARRQWIRFKKQIAPLDVSFYPTPGNHDVTTKEIQPAYTETWGEDKLYYSFDTLNSHFIILNTYLNQNFDSIPLVELNWLKEDLEKAKEQENIFISMHSPLYLNKNYDWSSVHNLLKQYNVRAVFTGHYHTYDYRIIDGIKYFCLNSSGNMNIYNEEAGRSHNFLYVTVEAKQTDFTVFTKDNMYPPDFVQPGESSRAGILEANSTIILNFQHSGIDTTFYVKFTNNADYLREYTINPEVADEWTFEPYGYKFSLNPGEIDSVSFHVKYKGPEPGRTELPRLNVSTEYLTQKKAKIDHHYVISLFNPPVTYANDVDEDILIDGIDKEISWNSAEAISKMEINDKGSAPDEQTITKVIYDEDYIYVFLKGFEPMPKGLSSSAYGEIPLVFGDDDFELYFDTNRDLKTFYRLMVNPKGTILSSGPEGRFTFKFEVKTHIDEKYWSAEFKIPLKEFKIFNNLKGETWGFNVRRHRQQSEDPQSDWSKMNNYPPYQPEYFGLLRFK